MSAVWRVPPSVIREGKLLLDQQCWCWGQDIRHPEGNLLLTHGFVRERHDTEKDLSRYTLLPPAPSSQSWEERLGEGEILL